MLWQELQLIAWLADSRGSKYNIFPSKSFAGVAGLPGNAGAVGGIGLNCACAAVINASAARSGPQKTKDATIVDQ
jgi:nitrate/nitrite transporter NarK